MLNSFEQQKLDFERRQKEEANNHNGMNDSENKSDHATNEQRYNEETSQSLSSNVQENDESESFNSSNNINRDNDDNYFENQKEILNELDNNDNTFELDDEVKDNQDIKGAISLQRDVVYHIWKLLDKFMEHIS